MMELNAAMMVVLRSNNPAFSIEDIYLPFADPFSTVPTEVSISAVNLVISLQLTREPLSRT